VAPVAEGHPVVADPTGLQACGGKLQSLKVVFSVAPQLVSQSAVVAHGL
jgi:hypothetical protein